MTLAKLFEEKLHLGCKPLTPKNIFILDTKMKNLPGITLVAMGQGVHGSNLENSGTCAYNHSPPFKKKNGVSRNAS